MRILGGHVGRRHEQRRFAVKRSLFATILGLGFGLAAIPLPAAATEYVGCQSCTTQASFESFTEAYVGSHLGQFAYTVINWNSEVAYDVWEDHEYDGELHQYFVTVWSQPSAQSVKDAVERVKTALNEADTTIQLPNTTGTASFATYESQAVGAIIVQQQWYLTLSEDNLVFLVWQAITQDWPIAAVLFPNGDVAKFTVKPNVGSSVCCTYVPGSARDINGNFINDSGLGGTGYTDGVPYVNRLADDGSGATRLQIHMDQWVYFQCSRIGNGPWVCERIT
jgi:hypothetical protein